MPRLVHRSEYTTSCDLSDVQEGCILEPIKNEYFIVLTSGGGRGGWSCVGPRGGGRLCLLTHWVVLITVPKCRPRASISPTFAIRTKPSKLRLLNHPLATPPGPPPRTTQPPLVLTLVTDSSPLFLARFPFSPAGCLSSPVELKLGSKCWERSVGTIT